jgi:hypothetical protein
MIQDLIQKIWEEVMKALIHERHRFSSEKSVVFDFAWKLKTFDDEILLDFEKLVYNDFSGGRNLDLYFEYKGSKVGMEFKYPRKSENNNNSDQTVQRRKIIHDIKRLSYLVSHQKIDVGIFLLVVDEKNYISGKEKLFKTFQDTVYKKNELLPVCGKHSKEEMICLKDFMFDWVNICRDKKTISGSVAWIKPIIIHN